MNKRQQVMGAKPGSVGYKIWKANLDSMVQLEETTSVTESLHVKAGTGGRRRSDTQTNNPRLIHCCGHRDASGRDQRNGISSPHDSASAAATQAAGQPPHLRHTWQAPPMRSHSGHDNKKRGPTAAPQLPHVRHCRPGSPKSKFQITHK